MDKMVPGGGETGDADKRRRTVPDRSWRDGPLPSEFSEDADVVRAAYRALEENDARGFARAADPRIEWIDPLVVRLPFDGTRRGLTSVLRAAFRRDEDGAGPRISAETFLEFGDGVLVAGRFIAGDGAGDGDPFLHECSVRRGRIFRIRAYPA